MSFADDDLSTSTPPILHSPKRLKRENDFIMKVEYFGEEGKQDHLKHVFLLQVLANSQDTEIKVINNKGQLLKESAIPALCDPAIHNNHFNVIDTETHYNGTRGKKLTILHRICGANDDRILKKDAKIMDYLKQNKIRMNKHMWNEDEFHQRTLGFFTNVVPSVMSPKYATKVIMKQLKQPVKKQKTPPFRLRSMSVAYNNNGVIIKARVYGIEVKTNDTRLMTEILKENTSPGNFIPFQMRRINKIAYQKAINYVRDKSTNIWTIVIKYMSEGAQFKLEDRIKTELQAEHVIYNPLQKQTRVLVHKKEFHSKREQLKVAMTQWTQDLDPDDIREFETLPEIAHVMQHDYSTGDTSFFSTSIETIMSFEVEEVEIRSETTSNTNLQSSTSTSEVSTPVLFDRDDDLLELNTKINNYQKELKIYLQKVDQIHTMLEALLKAADVDKKPKEDSSLNSKKSLRPT